MMLMVLSIFVVGCGEKAVVEPVGESGGGVEVGIEAPDADASDTTVETAEDAAVDETQVETAEETTEAETETVINPDEPYLIKILQGVYIEPKNPVVKVGQEVVFINQPVEDKKDTAWTLVGRDGEEQWNSEVMGVMDQFSYTYNNAGYFPVTISPGGAFKITVVE